MKYQLHRHIALCPLSRPVNDNCLGAGQSSLGPSFGRINTVRTTGPSQSAFMRIFAAARADIERGCYE